jgi:hydrogenase large subunit
MPSGLFEYRRRTRLLTVPTFIHTLVRRSWPGHRLKVEWEDQMGFENLPLELDGSQRARLKAGLTRPYSYTPRHDDVNQVLLSKIAEKNKCSDEPGTDLCQRIGGGLAIHCAVDLSGRKIIDVASMATVFRGYETLLIRRDLRETGLISSTAGGICGGVHATASAQCLEMALGIKPPPLAVTARNLLLSSQYLADHVLHLFILSGPDYAEAMIRRTNPEIWAKAELAPARHAIRHGYEKIGAILADLNSPDGRLYRQAFGMIRLAREAYAWLCGTCPHSEAIVPGGVALDLTETKIEELKLRLLPFSDYAKKCISIWDDVFDFLYQANPDYQHVGEGPATMIDFGQWDHEEYYDASYENCNEWGVHRWSTPGAIVAGELKTTWLTDLNIGIEDFSDRSYYDSSLETTVRIDPLGNPLSPYHPWNKKVRPNAAKGDGARPYSWATATTWDRHTFEVGAYARVYLSALAGKTPASAFFQSTGKSLVLHLAADKLPEMQAEWHVPGRWNAFERNRARAYALAFTLTVISENCQRAASLIRRGESRLLTPFEAPTKGRRLGAGFCGASRGFLAHWAVINDGVLANYQIAIPSRLNAGPRSPWGQLGACEQAVLNTPILETNFAREADFKGIDILRAIQSFDPCVPCTAHLLTNEGNDIMEYKLTTSCTI